jgi:Flp pilus assembly protein TadD
MGSAMIIDGCGVERSRLARMTILSYRKKSKAFMATLEDQYDEAMFAFSTGDLPGALSGLNEILALAPDHFDAQLALGLVYSRMGDYSAAIREGHKAERLRPNEPLVHTNLSLFYLKIGNKAAAEHHGARARIASWKDNLAPPPPGAETDPELRLNQSSPRIVSSPPRLPDMPWKNKP